MFGRNFTQFENSTEKRRHKQLCQYQAHAVNHQPTKCRTADFYNRQNGTSWESDTFPIKKQQKQKTCFPALFSEGWANHELLSVSAQCFFCYQNIKKFQPFPLLALLCFMHFFSVTHGILYSNLIFWNV